jgi:NAD+ kinase
MRFGFLLRPGQAEAPRVAADLIQVLRTHGCPVVATVEDAAAMPGATVVPADQLGSAIDVLVVLGGDGTFLHGASLVADHGVTLLGINLGSLGFMTHASPVAAREAVEAACAGRLPIDERMRLEVTVRCVGRAPERRSALNEAVILRATPRLLDLAARLDGDVITTYKADGLIVSTPTGSTAYNLAAGGPILTPNLEAIVLTPVCPHTLTNRPVVVRADARLEVSNVSPQPVSLTIDGLWSRDLAPGDAIDVRKTERPLRMFHPQDGFFAVLRSKLAWGERHETPVAPGPMIR